MTNRTKKNIVRVSASLLLLGAVNFVLFFPALPWSTRLRHSVKRALVKTEIRIARLRGKTPHLVSIQGTISTPGARIETLDSPSGWAATADQHGNFTLPAEMWYPGARYDLIVTSDAYNTRYLNIGAADDPGNSVLHVGPLPMETSCRIDTADVPGVNSVSLVDYDSGNVDFYQETFARLASSKATDKGKILEVLGYVSSRLDFEQGAADFETPRATLERGSRYCGCLSLAMAALCEAGGYKTRVIHLNDGATPPITHAVVEVYYADKWHVFDPTLGIGFLTSSGDMASYKEIRLDSSLVVNALPSLDPETRGDAAQWMPGVYSSGCHHYFSFKRKETRAIWWPFRYTHTMSAAGLIGEVLPVLRMPGDLIERAVDSVVAVTGEKRHAQGICRRCEMRAVQRRGGV